MKVDLTKVFKYAANGIDVTVCEPGVQDMPDRYGQIAIDCGYGTAVAESPAPAEDNVLQEAVEQVVPTARPRRKAKKKRGSR